MPCSGTVWIWYLSAVSKLCYICFGLYPRQKHDGIWCIPVKEIMTSCEFMLFLKQSTEYICMLGFKLDSCDLWGRHIGAAGVLSDADIKTSFIFWMKNSTPSEIPPLWLLFRSILIVGAWQDAAEKEMSWTFAETLLHLSDNAALLLGSLWYV